MKQHIHFLKKYIMSRPSLLLISVILMCLESLSFLSIIGLQQRLIDDILLQGQYELVPEIVSLFVLAFLLYAVLFTYAPHMMHRNQSVIQSHMADDFMSYVYRISIRQLQKERIATYVHYITQDLDRVADMIGNQIPRGIQQLFVVLFVAVMIGMASPVMLIACFILGTAYVSLGRVFGVKLKKAAGHVQKAKSGVLVHIEQGISSTREVLAYHRLAWEKERYDKLYNTYYEKVMHEGKQVNLKMITSEPLNWGVRVLILGYGGWLVLQGELSIGMFVVLFQLGFQFIQYLQDLFNSFMDWSAGGASVERLLDVMEGEQMDEGNTPVPLPLQFLSFNHVDFSYEPGRNVILNNLTFDIPMGLKIAIVGTSGSGKSTIAHLLIRYFDPDAGRILVNGMPLNQLYRSDWTERIGIVFQEPYLFPDTIQNNLLMGTEEEQSANLMRSACEAAQIDEYILSLPEGYDTFIGDRGITLSGGQRQRLAIARALIQNRDILILDEATSALDLTTERRLQQAVDRYREGKTTIVIAHRLSTIQNADLIFVMHKGEMVESGTHDQLLNREGLYREMVSLQDLKGEGQQSDLLQSLNQSGPSALA
ncbi:ABC transporter ATP-binding protein [Paenibacillus amylolyticus]|uniref:ABC transporter ATP-binding protein n=1 Tax=Paenibacillus amylolyticus TaxID=1451 RepID=UPI00201DB33F|nr:ABC transporter ATP-binding protein [Paenibacillus amylolyticus]MCL6661643.1 ABC transporter ATP-binding protein/permease [Paenibacillus amylolyticus]